MKRSRGGFGGGTGDVNPQWFAAQGPGVSAAYADTATVLPRERLPYGGKSQVMEVLKVQFVVDPAATLDVSAAGDALFFLTTKSFGTTVPSLGQMGGTVICHKRIDVSFAGAPATFQVSAALDSVIDLTDNAGNGVLVATDSIFVGFIQTAGAKPITSAGTGKVAARIFYRWKNVALTEYIGIVQSNQ